MTTASRSFWRPALPPPRRAAGALLTLAGIAMFSAHPGLISREALYPAVTAIVFAGVLLLAGAHRLADGPAGRRDAGPPLTFRSGLFRPSLVWTSGLLAFSILLSTLASGAPDWYLVWVPAAHILYVWLGCWLAADEVVLARLGTALLALASAAGAYALVQHLNLDPLPPGTEFEDRVVSVFDNPNHLGSCMAVALPLALHCFLTRAELARRRSIWLYGAVIAVYTGLLLSGSRGAWWACLAGCALLAAGCARRVRRGDLVIHWRHLLLLSVSLGVVTYLLSSTQIMKGPEGPVTVSARMRSSTNVVGPSAAKDSTISHRYFLWQVAVDMIRQRPLIGLGYGSYREQYPRFRDQLRQEPQFQQLTWLQQRYIPLHAHNEYLHRWAESGAFALLSFLALVGLGMSAALRAGWRGHGGLRGWAILGSLAAALVHGLVSYPFHMPVSGPMFWILLGIIYNTAQTRPSDR